MWSEVKNGTFYERKENVNKKTTKSQTWRNRERPRLSKRYTIKLIMITPSQTGRNRERPSTQAVIPRLSYPSCETQAVIPRLSDPGCRTQAVRPRQSDPVCETQSVVPRLSDPGTKLLQTMPAPDHPARPTTIILYLHELGCCNRQL